MVSSIGLPIKQRETSQRLTLFPTCDGRQNWSYLRRSTRHLSRNQPWMRKSIKTSYRSCAAWFR
jgi:hypothetical protein